MTEQVTAIRDAAANPTTGVSPDVTGSAVRERVHVSGVVQGVGFRPFVHGLATRLDLAGSVWNTGDGVVIEIQGVPAAVAAFSERLPLEAPELAMITEVSAEPRPVEPGEGFTIAPSRPTQATTEPPAGHEATDGSSGLAGTGSSVRGTGRGLLPPDVAPCDACRAELHDPADRRYRHPFITCTSCGPRYTIVTGLPYDRPLTTMADFPMCADCEREYTEPTNRRFHAQPICCPACGPQLELIEAGVAPDRAVPGAAPRFRDAALARARELLAAGAVVAVKGIGGYHVACDATSPTAVARLRERKQRGAKPFAVLVRDLDTARALAEVGEREAALLQSLRRPIVLLRRKAGGPIAEEVAPGIDELGLMLPPSPLHELLLGLPGDPPGPAALVLTSGNLSGQPIVTADAEALASLRGIVDAWLRHDRPIHVPCDDSVVRVVRLATADGDAGAGADAAPEAGAGADAAVGGEVAADGGREQELVLRRSRGYVPAPVPLPVPVPPLLAAGGDLKSVSCLAAGRLAWLSAHVGDLDDLASQRAFERTAGHVAELTALTPGTLVADRHPGYHSGRWAARRAEHDSSPLVRVQHHHAHVAAVMAEQGLDADERVIGIALDGTGYGDDGAIWGGEILVASYTGFERFAHLGYVPLAGGDASVRRPYRMALAQLHAAGVAWDERLPCVTAAPEVERRVLAKQLTSGLACVPTSSAGRLFDAVSSLAGVRHEVSYEAQAAIELEVLARAAAEREPGSYLLPLTGGDWQDGRAVAPMRLDPGPLIRTAATDVLDGADPGVVAARFHRGLAAALTAAAERAREVTGIETVVLSGGSFANTVLLQLVWKGLQTAGFEVLLPRVVPPGDGGLALGQVVAGAALVTELSGRTTTRA